MQATDTLALMNTAKDFTAKDAKDAKDAKGTQRQEIQ